MDLFDLHNADNHKYPVIVSIPHSGTFVPDDISSGMSPSVVLSNVDWFLKELYDFLPDMGITVISSNISRYVIDLNRDKTEDINGEDFWTKLVHTHNAFGNPLYSKPLQPDKIQGRLKQYYYPYHTALEKLIEEKLRFYNKVLLLDLHSFCVDFIEGANEDISLSN
ncbi:N-formylglutamate amidohydrolase [Faecalispora jeddahensis]|uniref:N-formylglutamate amidohydrolase n=1 Tax=Faecalispora jeddahensis TaxID=1414721 RepID=UPI00189AFF85|nr:N-formylglutamate amidohydrolase [Faecalispora jeddahensis]